jgi:hypothetical protein
MFISQALDPQPSLCGYLYLNFFPYFLHSFYIFSWLFTFVRNILLQVHVAPHPMPPVILIFKPSNCFPLHTLSSPLSVLCSPASQVVYPSCAFLPLKLFISLVLPCLSRRLSVLCSPASQVVFQSCAPQPLKLFISLVLPASQAVYQRRNVPSFSSCLSASQCTPLYKVVYQPRNAPSSQAVYQPRNAPSSQAVYQRRNAPYCSSCLSASQCSSFSSFYQPATKR